MMIFPWPLFLSFIILEEYNFKQKIIELKEYAFNTGNNNNITRVLNNNTKNKNLNNLIWWHNISCSCRYDSFLLFYNLIIKISIINNNIQINY